MLVDPLLPPPGSPDELRFFEALDRDVRRLGRPVRVVETSADRGRDSARILAAATPRRATTRVARNTIAIQTRPATETCASTTPQGSWLCHWYSPIAACSGSRIEQRSGELTEPLGTELAPPEDDEQDDDRDREGGRDAHVHVGGVDQVADAADVGAARVGPRRGRERTRDDQPETEHCGADRPEREPAARDEAVLRAAWHAPRRCSRAPSTEIASRKWLITKYGFRSVRTVIAPSGIWKSVPTATPAHSQRPSRSASERDTHQVTIAATIPASAIARFENSITAWYCAGGTGPPWQSGQSGQPRPEPLSRTKAPDATFRYIASTSTNVSRANPAAIGGEDARDASTHARRDGDADCHRDSA